ncbi:hypothetical protein B0J17DRAFT_120451 [Rhizoctonia solani]|nr:hypothetical protein B0J17DRAFT_120451 [Rhizoctonia solani]
MRCISQGSTDKCKYDEVKKSKLTIVKEENNELKLRIANLERLLQPKQLDVPNPPSAPRTAPETGSPRFSTYSAAPDELEEYSEPDYEHEEGTDAQTDTSWLPTPGNSPAPSVITSSPIHPPTSKLWQNLFDPNARSTSDSSSISHIPISYPRSVVEDHGRHHGDALYDTYEGAPPQAPSSNQDAVAVPSQSWNSGLQQTLAHPTEEHSSIHIGYSRAIFGDWLEKDDLSVTQRDFLIKIFLQHHQRMGLEIWVPDFLASLDLPPKDQPHPGLMWMIYSFAAFLSEDPQLQADLPHFLERARRNLEKSYAKGDRLFDYVRGQTLYASIMCMSGKIHQGAMATVSACHAAMVCGLHKISSPVMTPTAQHQERSPHNIRPVRFQLEPATSPREHGERIAAFWQLILLDHSIATTSGIPATFSENGDERSRVETVFPRPLEEYINGKANEVPCATLADIFTSRVIPNPADTIITMQVKATALMERAVRLAINWDYTEHTSATNSSKYYEEYIVTLQAIEHFESYLPGLRPQEGNGAESQLTLTSSGLVFERLFPHFVIWNAKIQLYNIFEGTQTSAREERLKSARDIKNLTTLLTDEEMAHLDMLPRVSPMVRFKSRY